MRSILLVLLLAACAHDAKPAACPPAAPPKKFAMRTYEFVVLRRGPAWTTEQTPESKKLFEGHMANIKAMARARKLLVAGPFDDDASRPDAIAGIFIFDTTNEAEVKELLSHDPAIAASRLTPELHVWYGPSGLTYDGVDEAIAK